MSGFCWVGSGAAPVGHDHVARGACPGRTVTTVDWTRLPLARASVDRAAHRRGEPDLLELAWEDQRTAVLLVAGGRLLTRVTDLGDPVLDLRSPAELDGLRTPDCLVLFLGQDVSGHVIAGRAWAGYLALVLPDTPEVDAIAVGLEGVAPTGLAALLAGATWSTLRDVGHALPDRDAGLAVAAVGLAAWHERHPRCSLCGAPTVPAEGGWTRRCTVDGSDHYPRTDPAVIMAVLDDDDRLLLGHAAHWPERRFSTLAGYVEPGESLEGAVRREVAEEVGITIGDVSYQGSQPWPFPASLMLAFVAHALTTVIMVDGVELTEARWFTRAELARAVAEGTVLLPMRTSVALALIEDWFGGPVGGSWA